MNLDDKLWNSEYADHLVLGSNIRTHNEEIVDIKVNAYLNEGFAHLNYSSTKKGQPEYSFSGLQSRVVILDKLRAFRDNDHTKTEMRSVRVDTAKLSDLDKETLENIFRHPVFLEGYTVALSASKAVQVEKPVTREDFNDLFYSSNCPKLDEKGDVYLILRAVKGDEIKFQSFNLTELYINRYVELNDIIDLLEFQVSLDARSSTRIAPEALHRHDPNYKEQLKRAQSNLVELETNNLRSWVSDVIDEQKAGIRVIPNRRK